MKEQVEDDLPLPELRGMLRLKKIEIQRHLGQEDVRLARVEARLRQLEEARLKAKRRDGVIFQLPSGSAIPMRDDRLD